MSLKTILFVANALLIQSITAQCIGYGAAPIAAAPCAGASFAGPYGASAYAPYANGYNAAAVPSSNGGGLGISSASPILPSGVSVLSQNTIEGPLAVGGQLPFLGTVALEGALPTVGAGNVAYGCGNGNVGILAEEAGAAGYNALAGGLGYGAGPASLGFNSYAGYSPAAYGYGAGCGCAL